jgi:predicted nucleotidyltransferase
MRGTIYLTDEIKSVTQQIIDRFNPKDVILFGSYAKGLVIKESDIDICVIFDSGDKRKIVQEILLETESETDLDIVVFLSDEWDKYKDDQSTFAGIVNRTGVSLIAGFDKV